MSNHMGSHLINDVLKAAIEVDLFKNVDKKVTKEFLEAILKVSWFRDCNPGEIFEGIGAAFGYCFCCNKFNQKIVEDDMCAMCLKKFN